VAEALSAQMPTPSSAEGDEHRVLAADMSDTQPKNGRVRPVQDAVDRQREGQRRQRHADQADRHVVDLEVLGDRRELRGRHQAAGADHHEHHVHHPEDRRAEHLGRACSRAASAAPCAGGPPATSPGRRRAQQQRRSMTTMMPWPRPNQRKAAS
jgi:hypothetical protein